MFNIISGNEFILEHDVSPLLEKTMICRKYRSNVKICLVLFSFLIYRTQESNNFLVWEIATQWQDINKCS